MKKLSIEIPFSPGTEVYFMNGDEVKKGTVWQYGYEEYLWASISVSKNKVVTVRADRIAATPEKAMALKETQKVAAENLESNQISIETVFGTLVAEIAGDPNYPGIYLYLQDNTDNIKKTIALAEATPDHPVDGAHALRLLVWRSMNDMDNYSDDFTFLIEDGGIND